MNAEIRVQLPSGAEVRAGSLTAVDSPFGSTPTSSFRYDAAYLALPEAYNLSPELHLDIRAQDTPVHRQMFLAFEDCGPDRWGRNLLQEEERVRARAENRGYRRLTQFDELLRVPDDVRQGAIRFYVDGLPVGARSDPESPTQLNWNALIQAADDVSEGRELSREDLSQLFRNGSTAPGGARPKINVIGAADQLQLAKLPQSDDRWNVSLWEAVTLTLARRAGIDVPDHRLYNFAPGRSILMIDRFDRRGEQRIGYLSARALLRVEDPVMEPASYQRFAAELSMVSGSQDLEELYRRIAFTLMVDNADDHLRNHGVLRHARGWRLSPMFDVNPNIGARFDSTPIIEGGERQDRDIRELLDAREAFRLTRARAVTILKEVETATRDWREVGVQFGEEPEAADRFARAFDGENRARVRDLKVGTEDPAPRRNADGTFGAKRGTRLPER